MDHVYFTTIEHQKRNPLFYDKRVMIQIRLKDRLSANKIAKEIGYDPNTVRNEIHRGSVSISVKCSRWSLPDNVSEFSRLFELEKLSERFVYYTHQYTSCEKGTNEHHNGIIRRFIPKGKRISDFDEDYIAGIEIWCNSLPRKILNYRTPDEVFEDKLKIYIDSLLRDIDF